MGNPTPHSEQVDLYHHQPTRTAPGAHNGSNKPADLMKEFGGMMASAAAYFGIEALSLPEPKRLKARMAEAAKVGSKEMLCHYFGLFNATLLSTT